MLWWFSVEDLRVKTVPCRNGRRDDATLLPSSTSAARARSRMFHWQASHSCLHTSQKLRIVTTSAGTAHTPSVIDSEGFPVTEASASAQYLIRAGVDAKHIVQEAQAWDTIGNAWFTRVMHSDIRGWRRLLVVTSDFHLNRTKAIFEWVFALPPAQSSGAIEGSAPGRWCGEAQCWQYRLRFVGISDEGIEIAEERGKREAKSLEGVKQNAQTLKTMESLHEWLYTKHGAYAAAVRVERLPPSERKIYNG
mmetsp:Transcript_32696/g.103501  ORF Transcript_32696/g.103501 Transcript_32696/m.103501 type:complete len:250 (+) Transcript_32696:285-1034(+)